MALSPKKIAIPNWVPLLVTIGLGLTTLICLYIAGTRQLTNTESVLLGVLLSAASMLVSWLATHVYSAISVNESVEQATQAYSDNIRTLGVRAAEKVLNLSNQLQRLMDALSAALDDADEAEGTKQSVLLILRERIQSAIYNIETLKSMNDTFLSDWRGVIGEEIDRQQTLERQIQTLTLELRNQIRERELMRSSVASTESLAALENRINETEHRLTEKLTALPFKVGARTTKNRKEEVVLNCPACSEAITITSRTKKGSRKLIRCHNCKVHSKIHAVDDGEFEIAVVPMHAYSADCPICNKSIDDEIPDYSGAINSIECGHCHVQLIASRSAIGVNLRVPKGAQRKLPKAIYDAVFQRLPPRPWPTFIHKAIASELGVSNSIVSQVIGSIVEAGHFPLPAQQTASGQTESKEAEPSDARKSPVGRDLES